MLTSNQFIICIYIITDDILLNGSTNTNHSNETKKAKKPVPKSRTKCPADRKQQSKVKRKQTQPSREEHVDPVN